MRRISTRSTMPAIFRRVKTTFFISLPHILVQIFHYFFHIERIQLVVVLEAVAGVGEDNVLVGDAVLLQGGGQPLRCGEACILS